MHSSSLNRTALACTVVVGLLSACTSVMDSDKVNYKTDGVAKIVPLDIPPDLTQLSRDTRYAVPGGVVTASAMATRPSQSVATTAARQVNDVRIERDGKQRWLVVDRTAEEIWPIVHGFWKENGFEYVLDQQQLGLLETEWAENRAKIPQDVIRRTLGKVFDALYSSGERDKFRTRLERNAKGGVDIFITHRGMVEEYADKTKMGTIWQPRPSDSELEAEFLTRLMVKLGASAPQAKAAMAQQASASAATSLIINETASFVSLTESFDVAWRRVGVALDRTGFTVEDRDRSQGVYFVRYVDTSAKEEKGFFSSLFSNEKAESGPVKYRVVVRSVDGKSQVSILNAAGQAENSAVTQRILKLLTDDLR
jgi:outer membrane protein assembly factor BamC